MSYVGEGRYPGQVLCWDETYECYRWLPQAYPSAGDVLTWNGSSVSWQPGGGGGFTAGGDLSGTDTSQTVIGIQGRSVAATAPTDGQVLTWNNGASQWEPQTPGGGGGGATPPVYDTIALAEAATGTDNDLCYVVEADTWYRYEATEATVGYVDHKIFLTTGDGGDTRWVAVAGRYGNCVNSEMPILGLNSSTSGPNTRVFLGRDALAVVGTSPFIYGYGQNEVALGFEAGLNLQDGDSNTLVGARAGRAMVSDNANVVVGTDAALTANNQNNLNNVFVGKNAAGGLGSTDYAQRCIYFGLSAGYQSWGQDNIYIGAEAGYGASGNSTGQSNVGIGFQSLYNGPSGSYNLCVGDASGYSLAGGGYNVLFGKDAGYDLTEGDRNCGVGVGTLAGITTGSYNIGIGDGALDGTLDPNRSYAIGIGYRSGGHGGDYTIYIGDSCGWQTGVASYNIGIGYHALMGGVSVPLTGTYNLAIGDEAGQGVVGAASNNVIFGRLTGYGLTSGSDNILAGTEAGYSLAASNLNIAFGEGSQRSATQASDVDGQNVTLGTNSGRDITSGRFNTCMGNESGRNIVSGDNNTCLGNMARVDAASGAAQNRTAVGYNAECLSDNDVRLGELGATTVHGGPYTTDSDERFKTDIEDCDLGLDFVQGLQPRKYKMKAKPDKPHHGFIAQEVKALLDSLGVESNIHDVQESGDGFNPQSINYTAMVAPLVKAVQELSSMVDDLTAEVAELEGDK